MKKLLLAISGILCLCACGPIEPGQGLAADPPPLRGGVGAAETMRLPLAGANYNERRLYDYNRPEMLDYIQSWHRRQFLRYAGEKPANNEPAFQGMERSKSPFRQ